MSGSVFAPWASVREPLKYAVQLGKYFNCSIPEDLNQNHEKITECLRKIPADNLLTAKVMLNQMLNKSISCIKFILLHICNGFKTLMLHFR